MTMVPVRARSFGVASGTLAFGSAQVVIAKPLLIRQAIPDFESPIDADELAGLALEEEVERATAYHKE